MLAIDEANLPDPRRTLNELGFDSLTGVEFANRVGRSIGQHLNPALLFDYPTLESLAGYVVRDVLHLESRSGAAPSRPKAEQPAEEIRVQAVADVEGMSEEDMDALVSQQLEQLQGSDKWNLLTRRNVAKGQRGVGIAEASVLCRHCPLQRAAHDWRPEDGR